MRAVALRRDPWPLVFSDQLGNLAPNEAPLMLRKLTPKSKQLVVSLMNLGLPLLTIMVWGRMRSSRVPPMFVTP
jgi:hypothetical protein